MSGHSATIINGTRLRVSFRLELPVTAREDEITAWLEYTLNCNGSISGTNPLIHKPIEPSDSIVEWEFVSEAV